MSQCVWQKESTCLMFFCQYMLLSPSRDFSKTRNIYCFLQTVAQTLPGYSTVKNMPILVEKKRADPGTWSPVGRKWKSNLENYRSNCCQKEASKLSVLFFHFSLLCFPLDLAANQTPSVTVVMLA